MPFTRSRDHDIWWDSTGTGSPILLINGLSSPSDVWFRLAPLLAADHRVLTFDNLGTGRTGVPAEPWTMSDMAAAAAAVLEAAGEPRSAVLGISMGGMIAQELVLERPDLVSSLILVATHAGMAYTNGDPEAAETIRAAGALPPEERYAIIARFAHAPSTPQTRIDEDAAVRATSPTSQAGYDGQLAAAIPWSRLDELSGISCPTLVLHGAHDRMVGPSSLLSDTIPGAQWIVLPDAGHQLFTDAPDEGAQVVLQFLKELPA